MTTELKKQFFDTFGIKEKYVSHYDELYPDFKHYTMEYPQITDRILLELICILRTSDALLPIICSKNIEELKLEILSDMIRIQSRVDVKPQVQALFKEQNNETKKHNN